MPYVVETVEVPYPAQVVRPGRRKAESALLLAQVPVRILSGDALPVAAEVRSPGYQLPHGILGNQPVPGWTGEPWRYAFHPETGDLMTHWRPHCLEFDTGGRAHVVARSTASLQEIRGITGSAVGTQGETWAVMACNPMANPFAAPDIMVLHEGVPSVYRETDEFRAVEIGRTPDGQSTRDIAVAYASAVARRLYLEPDGRPLVPTAAPRWALLCHEKGCHVSAWPGAMGAGWPQGYGLFDSERVAMVPASMPHLAMEMASPAGRMLGRLDMHAPGGLEDEAGILEKLLRRECRTLMHSVPEMSQAELRRTGLPEQAVPGVLEAMGEAGLAREVLSGTWNDGPVDPVALVEAVARIWHASSRMAEHVGDFRMSQSAPAGENGSSWRVLHSNWTYMMGHLPSGQDGCRRVLAVLRHGFDRSLPSIPAALPDPSAEPLGRTRISR